MRWGACEANPVVGVDQPRVESSIVRFLTADEESKLLAAAKEPLRAAIIVAIHTGLRESEQRLLKWEDVNFDRGEIVVRHTKAKKDRVVPLNNTARTALSTIARVPGSPYVFVNRLTGRPFDRFNNHAWRALLRRCEINEFRWHDCRHSFASNLVQKGTPLAVIKELLGHGNVQVTHRYAHLADKNLRSAVRALDGSEASAPIPSRVAGPTAPADPKPLLPLYEVANYLSLDLAAVERIIASGDESPLARLLRRERVELAPGLAYVRRKEFLEGLRHLMGGAA